MIASPEDQALGQRVIEDIRSGTRADLESLLPPELDKKIIPVFPQMRSLLPIGSDTDVSLVDAGVTVTDTLREGSSRQSYLAYEVDAGQQHALVKIGILRRQDEVVVTDLYVYPLPAPIEELTKFTFRGKGPVQYTFVVLALLSIGTIIAALIRLFRMKGIKRKWLWTVGCLFGVGAITVNWSTGAIGIKVLTVYLFGAFAAKHGFLGPWEVGFAIPIVAIIILLRPPKPKELGARTPEAPPPTEVSA